jgi:hypothetical protein
LLGRPREAIQTYKRTLADYNFVWSHVWLAVDYSEIGQDQAAHAEAAEILKLDPQLTSEMSFPTDSVQAKAVPEVARFRADLRKAGLK